MTIDKPQSTSALLEKPHYTTRIPLRLVAKDGDEAQRRQNTRNVVQELGLNTVCQEAACPNLASCWSRGTASFMILGKNCTRRCKFCHVTTARPEQVDAMEAQRLAESVARMNLNYVVVTSVDRDDLADCGSQHFADCIIAIKEKMPQTKIEVLIPDFKAKRENLQKIWEAKPDVINHNVETVPSLFRKICPQSSYEKSLDVLKSSKKEGFLTKSGIILGLGEEYHEVEAVIDDLRKVGVDFLSIGQYLRPSEEHAPIRKYYSEEEFSSLKEYALAQGMIYVEAGPLIRSSFHAERALEFYDTCQNKA